MKKLTIETMKRLAAARGGQFLSEHYMNSSRRHLWQCLEGHRWEATPASLTQGSWCPYCAGLARKTTADMVALAKSRGGKFISSSYVNATTKCEWECADGHRWFAVPNSIQQGTWCPECGRFLSERVVRLHFEQLFGEKFPTQKPKWLINSRGNRMELDGYSSRLGLAFEYHGQQHFDNAWYFHREPNALAKRIADDCRKRELCKAKGVILIEIPYHVGARQMKAYIMAECERLSVHLPAEAKNVSIKILDAFLRTKLEGLQEYAMAKGGMCLSDAYINSATKLEWKCAKGHHWWATPNSVQSGHWCPFCVGKNKKTIEEMRALAASRCGKCLSARYVNNKTPLQWECEHGHQWWTVGSSIRRGSWCRICAGLEKGTIEEMRLLARIKGGECLSSRYINIDTSLEWKCEKGHEWLASPWNIKKENGTWCPVCSGNQKKSIEDMQSLARSKGGYCRSTEYRNARTNLVWECARGHKWSATPDSIQQGSWCRKCSRKTVEDMQVVACIKGGQCMSVDYIDRYTPLSWKCAEGHIFVATPNAIRQGGWCKECWTKKMRSSMLTPKERIARRKASQERYRKSQRRKDWEKQYNQKTQRKAYRRAYNKQYFQSKRGKAAMRRYRQSAKYKAARQRYQRSPK